MSNAQKFVELLMDGKIKKHILPNSAPNYSDSQEKMDLENYLFFANSFAFDEIMKCEVAFYNGDEQN